MNGLDLYIERLDGLVKQLTPVQQKHLLHKIGRQIRQNNKRRIAANIAPDGAAFTARQGTPSAPLKSLRAGQDFLYHGKIHRYRTLKDYGSHYIGWDYHTRNTFKAIKDQIRRPIGGLRQKVMFRKIHQYKYLKLKADSHEAAIGFLGGLVGHIAAAHQYGQDNRPERTLLGFSDDDLAMIEQTVMQHFQFS